MPDLAAAQAGALKAIENLRQESPSVSQDWNGWRLEVADASGAVLLSVSLDTPIHRS